MIPSLARLSSCLLSSEYTLYPQVSNASHLTRSLNPCPLDASFISENTTPLINDNNISNSNNSNSNSI